MGFSLMMILKNLLKKHNNELIQSVISSANQALNSGDFLESDQIVQLGYPPNRIYILTTLKDFKFEDCYKAKVEVKIQD